MPAAKEPEMEPLEDVFKTPCAGIDVHKKELSVCVEWRGADGKIEREVRHYDTKRKSVRAMASWFTGGCGPVSFLRARSGICGT